KGIGRDVKIIAGELFDCYRTHKQTAQKMSGVVVSLFEASGSFAEAKARMGLLEELKHIDPSFAGRIKAVGQGNSQIDGSWGVPERVAKLAQKWESVET